jgi:hypothetical protein
LKAQDSKRPFWKSINAEVPLNQKKSWEVRMCQKVFRRRMVLEGEKDNLEKGAVGTLEREREQTDEVLYTLLIPLEIRVEIRKC